MVVIIITQNTTLFAGGGSVSASILCYKWYISYTVMMKIFNLLCIVHNNNYNNYHNNYYYIILYTLRRVHTAHSMRIQSGLMRIDMRSH